MSNSLLSRAIKTSYKGVYKKETKQGVAFIARYTINKKTRTQIIGYETEGLTAYDAYKTRLDIISSLQLSTATEEDRKESYLMQNLFLKFIEFRKPLLTKNTNANYSSIYRQYILNDFKNTDIRNITADDLQKYINKLLSYRRPATVEKIATAFKKFYMHLQSKDIYRYNAASDLHIPKYDNKKYFSITKRDLNKVIEYIKDLDSHRYKTFYYMLFHGRRTDETRTLKWSDINFDAKVYYLNYAQTKTKKNQYFYLEDFQINALLELRSQNPSSIYVFENPRTKKPITYTSIFRIHRQLRLALNMPDYTLHSIRHTCGFMLVNNGYPLEVVAKLLGHADIKSTSRYAVLEMNKAQNAYKKTMGVLFSQPQIQK